MLPQSLPCCVRQSASAARLGLVELEGAAGVVELRLTPDVVVVRLATEGPFAPPQPAARSMSSAIGETSNEAQTISLYEDCNGF